MIRFFKCMGSSFYDLFLDPNSFLGGFINWMMMLLVLLFGFIMCQQAAEYLFPNLGPKDVTAVGVGFFIVLAMALATANKMIQKYRAGVC